MPQSILLPMCALAALTFVVLILVPAYRFVAAARRSVTVHDFALGESERVPAHVRLPNRNLANLLELPVLFYAVCLGLHVSGPVAETQVMLAWAFVALRLVHSVIHITINYVPLRLVAFTASAGVLVAMWALFTLQILNA